jgi:hypothetical protein
VLFPDPPFCVTSAIVRMKGLRKAVLAVNR